ncbi:Hypothetical protein, putative [Bodo saltans]|uniref:Uncharacterized protein n=1 Tax=Bodo saltans TaxID=75058 RepID=A0A0S4KIP2_BODSA|nr:Hypothetical protein, putative [Bodo saltans]|eukprot:CUI15570.1 Hypothetical protein, putative [Bodo saltans]
MEAADSPTSLFASLDHRGLREPPSLFNISVHAHQNVHDRDGEPLPPQPYVTLRATRFVTRTETAVFAVVIEVVGHQALTLTDPTTDKCCGCYATVERHHATESAPSMVNVTRSTCSLWRTAAQAKVFLDMIAAISGICSLTTDGSEAWAVAGRNDQLTFPCIALHRGSMGINQFHREQHQWSRAVTFATRGRDGVYQSKLESAEKINFADSSKYPSRIVPCTYASHPQVLLARRLLEDVAALKVTLLRLDVAWRSFTNNNITPTMTVWEHAREADAFALSLPAAVSFQMVPISWTVATRSPSASAEARVAEPPMTMAGWTVTSPPT